MNQVYLGIGSNKNHPYFRINTVLKQINRIKSTNIVKKSSLYVTKPLGPQAQPDLINYKILKDCITERKQKDGVLEVWILIF